MYMPAIFRENLFDDFFDDFARPERAMGRFRDPKENFMKTDVRENDHAYELDIELPGCKKEDVKASLKDGCLTISTETKQNQDKKDENGKYIRRERYFGSMSRSFYVGEAVTEEDIKARFEDGVLKMTVPKKEVKPEVPQTKYISIEG